MVVNYHLVIVKGGKTIHGSGLIGSKVKKACIFLGQKYQDLYPNHVNSGSSWVSL